MAHPATVAHPCEAFLKWCEKLNITNKSLRSTVLLNAARVNSHETVLFFLCGQDYLDKPTDLKGQAIANLFIGEGTPFQINVADSYVASIKALYNGGAGGGYRLTGGTANYHFATQALRSAVEGMGSVFLRDMVKGVAGGAKASGMSNAAIGRVFQDMRNHTRRFWMQEMASIGL